MLTCKIVGSTFLLVCLISAPALATEDVEKPWLRKLVFALLVHDRGPTSDTHESGLDPNWKMQFNPPQWKLWRSIGSPVPMLGVTPNFNGDTSVLYGGLGYELELSNRWADDLTHNRTKNLFVSGGLSLALHNGPLHKDKTGCRERSDCGFGYRGLPRLNIEIGTYFLPRHGVSLFYDHMSHKGVLPGENEGIDHTGIRYHFILNKPKS